MERKTEQRWEHTVAPARRRAVVLVALVQVVAVTGMATVVGANPAHASLFVVPAPEFPAATSVDRAVTAHLGIANHSTPPQSSTYPVLTVSAIDLVPACGDAVPDCTGAVMHDVMSLSATGTARSGPASCVGTWTITRTSPGIFRLRPPGGEGTLTLPTGAVCVVDYTVTAHRVPAADRLPPGQAVQVASATMAAPGATAFRLSGYDVTTIPPAPPTTTTST
ncbi:MAG: hypothetical protein M3179_15245, partial [Actinomycetota bacterium]|nr:hypothetical protein [Actinomycetota bacterium]